MSEKCIIALHRLHLADNFFSIRWWHSRRKQI